MPTTAPTLIARLTPPGAGAIATLAVRGPEAWPITRSLFRAHLPDVAIPDGFYLGRLGEEAGACDEVVLAIKSGWLELHCHGGTEIVRFIEDLYVARGVRTGSWQDFLAGTSPLSSLALQQLPHATTVPTAAILLDQVHGAFEKVLQNILDCIQNEKHDEAAQRLARLAQTQRLGRHLVFPFRVAIAGAPNVGKSSLVNALAGFTRSVVSPIPGTTRDVVTTRTALGGWPVELIDTAGLRESADPLEREGMARAKAALEKADLRLWVVDAAAPPRWPAAEIRCDGVIVNKVDLPSAWDKQPNMRVSAKTGQGIIELCQWIGSLLSLDEALAPAEGVAFTPELAGQVLRANDALRAGNWAAVEEIVTLLLSPSIATTIRYNSYAT